MLATAVARGDQLGGLPSLAQQTLGPAPRVWAVLIWMNYLYSEPQHGHLKMGHQSGYHNFIR